MTRQIVRCAHCSLNQFMPLDKRCRRCHKSFIPDKPKAEPPKPKPVPAADQPFEERFACTLRIVRMGMGLSQEALAARAKFPRSYVSKLERGHNSPTLKSFGRICKALDVSRATFATLMCAPCLN